MKRKTSTTAVKIYTFGCQQPTEEVRKTIFDNLYLSKQYANSAIAVENKYKVEYSKEQTSSSEQLKLLNEQKDILLSEQSNYRKQINKKNSDNKKLTNNESINSKLKTIQKELKVLNGKIKIEKEKLKGNENFQKNIEKNNELLAKERNEVNHQFSEKYLYWGIRGLENKSIEAKKKTTIGPLKFKHKIEGRIGGQIQKININGTYENIKINDVIYNHNLSKQIQIDPINYSLLKEKYKSQRAANQHSYTQVRIRIGSIDKNGNIKKGCDAPLWLTLNVKIHREMPPDAKVTSAWLLVTRIGNRFKYELQLVLESESFNEKEINLDLPKIGIDVGWRSTEEGLRIGYWADSNGNDNSIDLNQVKIVNTQAKNIIQTSDFCDSLRSANEIYFNDAKKILSLYLKSDSIIPDYIKNNEDIKYIHLWQTGKQLARLTFKISQKNQTELIWQKWKDHRLSNKFDLYDNYDLVNTWLKDNDIVFNCVFLYLEIWRHKNKHMYQKECDLRRKTLLQRDDMYQKFAKDLSNKYSYVFLEDIKHSDFNEKPDPENKTNTSISQNKIVKRNRNISSPGLLREIIKATVGKNRVIEVDSTDTTKIHIKCEFKNEWSETEKKEKILTCQGCGEKFDRDKNASQNILKRGCESLGDDQTTGTARSHDIPDTCAAE